MISKDLEQSTHFKFQLLRFAETNFWI
eukprot:GSChrysophyteH1.ASY1.ANO1.1218.1 assembled CDS